MSDQFTVRAQINLYEDEQKRDGSSEKKENCLDTTTQQVEAKIDMSEQQQSLINPSTNNPFPLIPQVRKPSRQLEFNSEENAQFQKKDNQNQHKPNQNQNQKKTKTKIYQTKKSSIQSKQQKNQKSTLNNYIKNLSDLFDGPECDSQDVDYSFQEDDEEDEYEEDEEYFEHQITRRKDDGFGGKKLRKKHKQTRENDNQNSQEKSRKKSFIKVEKWTLSQCLKYIAYVLVHEKDFGMRKQFLIRQCSNYVTNGNKKRLQDKNLRYRHLYPNKTLQELASILMERFSLTTEEVEAEKQRLLQYETEKQRILFPQDLLHSKFNRMLQSFPQHSFDPKNVAIISEEFKERIFCTNANYRFIPCAETEKSKKAKRKFYSLIYEIELELPSFQINYVSDSDGDSQQVKGYWITVDGFRKSYVSKSQAIDSLRQIDLENKFCERKIMDQIQGKKQQTNLQKEQESLIQHQEKEPLQREEKEPLQKEEQSQQQCSEKNQKLFSQSDDAKNQKNGNMNKIKKKREVDIWTYQQNLKFFQFLIIYEPAFEKMEEGIGGYKYFKIMEEYLETKTFEQCYDHFQRLHRPHKTFKQFMQKEMDKHKIDRVSIQDQVQKNITNWLVNNPIVKSEKRVNHRDYKIKLSLNEASDERVRESLLKFINNYKIKIILK